MKLFVTATSPYCRVVQIAARAAGVADRIEEVEVTLRTPDSALLRWSPLGRVPALETDDGLVLEDTRTICQYLDRMHVGAPFVALGGDDLWQARQLEAFAVSMMDGIAFWTRETRRAADERSERLIEVERQRLRRALDHLEGRAGTLPRRVRFGPVMLAVALDYADYRGLPPWREGRTALADWHAAMAAGPALRDTALPPAGT